jgi:hypothetical protein
MSCIGVSQTAVRRPPVVHVGSPGGLWWFLKKHIAKIVSDNKQMKNTSIHVCPKTAFVGWPSTETRRISSFHNCLSFNHHFRKLFKLVYRKHVVMITLTTGIRFSPIHLHAILGVENFMKVRMYANFLWSCLWLLKVWDALSSIFGIENLTDEWTGTTFTACTLCKTWKSTYMWYICNDFGLEIDCPKWGFSWFSSVSSGKCQDSCLKLGHDHLLPHPLQFIIHVSSLHSISCSLNCWKC